MYEQANNLGSAVKVSTNNYGSIIPKLRNSICPFEEDPDLTTKIKSMIYVAGFQETQPVRDI